MNNRRYTVTYYPEFLTRQPSYVCIHDLQLDTFKTFHVSKTLGHGEHGSVRLMTHRNEKIAVKGLLNPVAAKDSDETKQDAINEFRHLKKASGNSQLCTLNHYIEPPAKGSHSKQYSYRIVMPYVEGENLNDFARKNIKRSKDFILLILRFAQALQQLHLDGTCHGDITSNNTLVKADRDDFIVQFIDFGFAYPIDGIATSGFARLPSDSEYVNDIAEERYSSGVVPAHPSQDVYTFAKVLDTLLQLMGKEYSAYINKKYPVIARFIREAITDTIEDRPALDPFVTALEDIVDWTKPLDKQMRTLIFALEATSICESRQLLESKASAFTYDKLELLLSTLIANQKFSCALRLMQLKKRLSLEQISETVTHHLNDQDYRGNTLLHHAAKEGAMNAVFALLKENADLSITNSDGLIATDCAHADALPLLKLYKYLHEVENEITQTSRFGFFTSFLQRDRHQSLAVAKLILKSILSKADVKSVHELLISHNEGIMADKKLSSILFELAEQQYLPRKSLDTTLSSNSLIDRKVGRKSRQ